MRAMVLEYPGDPITHDLDDQYLFGDALLVAPVYSPTNRRTVYLPAGTWYDYWTGDAHTGPAVLHIKPDLEVLPLYVRADSIIPMGPDMAFVGEQPFDPITLDIWLEDTAECTLYDDREDKAELVKCRARRRTGQIKLDVSASRKRYIAKFNHTGHPSSVLLNGTPVPQVGSLSELEQQPFGWFFSPSFVLHVKFAALGSRSLLTLRVKYYNRTWPPVMLTSGGRKHLSVPGAELPPSSRNDRCGCSTKQWRNTMQGFRQQDNVLLWERNHETVQIEPWGRHSLRVRATLDPEIVDDLPQALLEPAPGDVQIEIGAEKAVISNGAIAAEVSFDPNTRQLSNLFSAGRIRFLNNNTGAEILAEKRPQFRGPPARYFRSASGGLFHLEMSLSAYEGERLYGLGQQQHGLLDQKGCVVDLLQRNTEVAIPFLLSSRGYGFLWNNPAVGRVELGTTSTRWVAEATRQLDYWITIGDTPAEILAHYADATGHPLLLPEWAAGFWQSKLRYRTQEELLAVAREHKQRGLPLSVIVCDYFHWTLQGDWQFDPEAWPDPAGMVRELAEMGIKLMVSIWPTVNPRSRNFEEMWQRGLLVRNERGLPAHKPFQDTQPDGRVDVQFYDATHPEARHFIWRQVRDNYYSHGIKTWWLDACEPDLYPNDPDNMRYHLGNGLEVTNIYPMLHAGGFYEGMRAEGETDIVTLCRSAWSGSQRYGIVLWSGDIPSTFESLRTQVRAGLNVAMSGIPWWTTDIGGFFGGDPDSPDFRELLVRWFQYGAFCPVFRLHGNRLPTEAKNGGPNEVWSYGDEVYGMLKELLLLRERLLPYIMDQMRQAHENGTPPMRPLFFDFWEDEGAIVVDDQFMLGPDLLVAPVLEKGARSREVFLPGGTDWTDAWTSKVLPGGSWISTEAPLERIPLYLRGKSKLPIRA